MIPVHNTNTFVELVCVLLYGGPLVYILIRAFYEEAKELKKKIEESKKKEE